jgi:hypothetical protein
MCSGLALVAASLISAQPSAVRLLEGQLPVDNLADPYEGGIRWVEFAAAALGGGAVEVGAAISVFAICVNSNECRPGGSQIGLDIVFVVESVLIPLVAAAGAYWVTLGEPRAGSFLKSVLLSFAAEVAVVLITLGLNLLQGSAAFGPAAFTWAFLSQVSAIPLAASFGLHWGSAVPEEGGLPPLGAVAFRF